MISLEQNLILVKGQDKTADIVKWENDSGRIAITFTSSNQVYRYSPSNVQFFKNPKQINPMDFRVLKGGQVLTNVVGIQQFEHHVRVSYKNGYRETFERNRIALMPSCLRDRDTNNCFSYFKELAHIDMLLSADGMPILLIEQNSNAALKVAHRGYVIENGEIVLQDNAENLLVNEDVKKAYLGGH